MRDHLEILYSKIIDYGFPCAEILPFVKLASVVMMDLFLLLQVMFIFYEERRQLETLTMDALEQFWELCLPGQ